jgi:choloylglycine hydrolase
MCTSFRLTASDHTVVIGRTMEYGIVLPWDLLVVPRGTTVASAAPDGAGATWTGTYGYVGTAIGAGTVLGHLPIDALTSVTDGVNERGLYAGVLYLPSYAEYEPTDGVASDRLLDPADLASYALATCATVAEVVAAVEQLTVWARPTPPIGVPPLHLVVHDRDGKSAVIEWVGGTRRVFDNDLGVCTNSPPFDWHLANLRNYVNLTANDVPDRVLGDQKFAPMGQGSGMLGLPGDPTPPSRFVRATAFVETIVASPDGPSATRAALHILNNFDIPKGFVRDSSAEGLSGTDGAGDYTAWSTVSELGDSPAYTIRTYDDPTPRRLALNDVSLAPGPVRRVSLDADAPLPTFEISAVTSVG